MKTDPTRTKSLRGKFERDLARRFKQIEKAIIQAIVKEDRLGLLPLTFNVVHEWAGLTDQQKLDQFSDFLDDEINAALVNQDDRFWERYIQDGYEKGAGRAFTDTNKRQFASANAGGQMFMAGKRAQFTSGMLQGPESADKLKLLAQRTFSDIQGVTDTMRTQLRRNLMDGLVQGQNPNVIARSMRDQMGINLRRAKTIARTETIRAHAEGQLDAMEQMGIEQVGVMVEWSTAGDARVCPLCSDVNGIVLRVKEAHGLIPRHPNCRCAFVPANVGESKEKQKRGQKTVQKALTKSRSRRPNDRWGVGTTITKERPIPFTKETSAKIVPHYHGTLESNIESILKEGIVPTANKQFSESSQGDRANKVFSTTNQAVAKWYGDNAALFAKSNNAKSVVFRIEYPESIQKKLIADTSSADSWMVEKIDPKWIKSYTVDGTEKLTGNTESQFSYVPVVFDK